VTLAGGKTLAERLRSLLALADEVIE